MEVYTHCTCVYMHVSLELCVCVYVCVCVCVCVMSRQRERERMSNVQSIDCGMWLGFDLVASWAMIWITIRKVGGGKCPVDHCIIEHTPPYYNTSLLYMYTHVHTSMYMYMYIPVCVCVLSEEWQESKWERGKECSCRSVPSVNTFHTR